jgi:lysophospholipase L1-like esterase
MFVGKNDEATFLFDPIEIISVRSSSLETEYVLGKDYEIVGNKIRLCENTAIPYFTEEEYYPQEEIKGRVFQCSLEGKNFIYFGESDTFIKKQIAVTYTAKKTKLLDVIDFSKNFEKTIKKLKNKEKIRVLFYGDSITVGANSTKFINVKPYAESYPEMITSYLKAKFNTEIEYLNTAKGGMTTEWGVDNVKELAVDLNPDLTFIAFGMNNGNLSPEEYADKIMQIVNPLKENNPNAEIMLISPMLPNREVKYVYGKQETYEEGLKIINQNYGYAYAPITSMHKKVLERKRYYDMTGNNVNHPNDFLARIYVQTILSALLGNDYTEL